MAHHTAGVIPALFSRAVSVPLVLAVQLTEVRLEELRRDEEVQADRPTIRPCAERPLLLLKEEARPDLPVKERRGNRCRRTKLSFTTGRLP